MTMTNCLCNRRINLMYSSEHNFIVINISQINNLYYRGLRVIRGRPIYYFLIYFERFNQIYPPQLQNFSSCSFIL